VFTDCCFVTVLFFKCSKIIIVIMLLTALYYASICSDASTLLLCPSIIRQGLSLSRSHILVDSITAYRIGHIASGFTLEPGFIRYNSGSRGFESVEQLQTLPVTDM